MGEVVGLGGGMREIQGLGRWVVGCYASSAPCSAGPLLPCSAC